MKIASWNVNSLRTRLPQVLAFLESSGADVLCLQETKVEDGQFPHAAFSEHGLFTACHGQKSYNGVAIVSRFPLTQVHRGMNGEDLESQTRVLTATVRSVRVMSVYVPNGEALDSPKFAFKKEFFKRLTTFAAAEGAHHPHRVVVGDFNVAADERDVPNPAQAAKSVMFTPEERAWLAEFQQKAGLEDALRRVTQASGQHTWWDYRTFRSTESGGMRLDYLFISEGLHKRVKGVVHHTAWREEPQPSDHIPITLELA